MKYLFSFLALSLFLQSAPALASPIETPSTARGLLLKLVDDGNAKTTEDATIYVIGNDGMRHAFPSAQVYRTWYANEEEIAFIDRVNLASYPIGAHVTVRPGTWLVKRASDPKTYAVEPGGVLRWITTEELARLLYGEQWAKRVMDVPEVFFGDYALGAAITGPVYPEGTLGVLPGGEVVYVCDAYAYSLPNNAWEAFRLQSKYNVSLAPLAAGGLITGTTLDDLTIAYPF